MNDSEKFLIVALTPESRMIKILGAALLVDADSLEWRRITARNPDVAPRGRNAKASDARHGFLIGDAFSFRGNEVKAAGLAALAADPMVIERPPPPRRLRRLHGSVGSHPVAVLPTRCHLPLYGRP